MLSSAAALLLALLAGPAVAQGPASAIQDAERATVRVAVIVEDPSGRMLYGTGSGFIVAPNLVVTNAHVVAVARQQPNFAVAVIPPGAESMLSARIIRYSPLTDLALLEFTGGPEAPPVTIATLEPHPGDAIIALGFPDVDDLRRRADDLVRPTPPSRSSGSIASLRDSAPTGDPIPTINHEAAISSGSSGGPLLDECGRVIGVNTWHARGTETMESRGVATRASQLIDFLEEAGVTPSLTDQRCLSFAERVEAERVATVEALQAQNRELTEKIETADRLTRIAVVILLSGTLALFVAVGVLGGILLSRRNRAPHPAPHHDAPAHEPHHEHPHHRRSALGVAAVVGGAAVAAVIVVAGGIIYLRERNAAPASPEVLARFTGDMTCTLDRAASLDAEHADDTSFTVGEGMCVNGRTLYAPGEDGQLYHRAILSGGAQALDVLTIDPRTGEFRRERFPLTPEAFAEATQAAGASLTQGCDGDAARDAVARRNATLLSYRRGEATQRIVWRCVARDGG